MGPVAASSGARFSLEDRYQRDEGAVYLTGIQALVRMLLDRARADQRAARATATYVTGYEGSPLGGLDIELARHAALLAEHAIVAQPGLNEELAATAVVGTQLARQAGELRYAGVTGVWYGKTPGLDRASDALRHANLIGTDPQGGALALAGDDPAAKSSTFPGSSELALADLGLPTFAPADAAEILGYGQHAVELSRASGLWAALKIATVVADGAATAEVRPWSPPDLTGSAWRPHRVRSPADRAPARGDPGRAGALIPSGPPAPRPGVRAPQRRQPDHRPGRRADRHRLRRRQLPRAAPGADFGRTRRGPAGPGRHPPAEARHGLPARAVHRR